MQDIDQLLGSLALLFVFCSLWVSFCSMALVVGDSLLCELLHLSFHHCGSVDPTLFPSLKHSRYNKINTFEAENNL